MQVSRTPSRNLGETAFRRLEEMIVTLELPPGRTISEAELSALVGIGRTPVREALQRLAADHLVVITPRRAIAVSKVSFHDQLLILETRRAIERVIVVRAARLATQAERLALISLADEMNRAVGDNEEVRFLRLDQEFNTLLADCARNPFASRALEPLYSLSRRFWHVYREPLDLAASAKAHQDLIHAITRGDEDDASKALDVLMRYVEGFVRKTMDSYHGK